MIAIAIVICEVAFWALLLAGVTARYAFGRPRLSTALLVSVPLADVVLLTVTAIDLAAGAEADWTHGLAAFYLGFSVVFGPTLVATVDQRFARRHGVQVAPPPAVASRLAAHWRLWLRCLAACALAAAVLGALVLVGGAEQTRALWEGGGWFPQLGLVSVLWLALGPAWTAVAERRRPLPSR